MVVVDCKLIIVGGGDVAFFLLLIDCCIIFWYCCSCHYRHCSPTSCFELLWFKVFRARRLSQLPATKVMIILGHAALLPPPHEQAHTSDNIAGSCPQLLLFNSSRAAHGHTKAASIPVPVTAADWLLYFFMSLAQAIILLCPAFGCCCPILVSWTTALGSLLLSMRT